MADAGWHFKRRERSDEVADPIQGEFFDEASDPDERRRGPAASVVREAIQNSLDAQVGDGPVHVRFYLSAAEGLAAERSRFWFTSLWPHLRARRTGLRDIQPDPPACRFIVIEDFGTSGLKGDPRRGTTPEEGERDDFFAFFRANGLSGKAGQEGGRWGVGKSVFNRASRINTFLALSVRASRASDRGTHLIGRCFLLTHKINGTEYQPYGRYGLVENDDFVLPVEDAGTLAAFRRDFCVARERDTPGLSVVVPYFDQEITLAKLQNSVIREYFYPILSGRLTVRLEQPEHEPVELTADSLLERAAVDETDAGGDPLLPLIRFALDAHTSPGTDVIVLGESGERPEWCDADTLIPPNRRPELACEYDRGKLLAFKVPLKLSDKGGNFSSSYFSVFLRRDRDGRGYPPVFVRGGIVIPKALERRVRGHSLFAMVVIEDEPLSSMLGDAETPAHTQWSPDTRNFRDKYEHGRATIDFIRTAAREIVDILSRAREERDWLALADFFPAPPEDEGLPEEDSGTDAGTETEPPPPPPPPPGPQPYRIEHVAGGFRILRDNPADTPLPAAIRVRVAYDTTRGSPLKRYHPADFDLSQPPIQVEVAAGQIEESARNLLLVRPDDDDFRIEVRGFDENRDLYVKAEPMEYAEAELPGNGTGLSEGSEAGL